MARVRYGSFLKPILHYKVGTFTTQLISRCSLFNLCKSEGFFYCIYKSKSGNCEALQNGGSPKWAKLLSFANMTSKSERVIFKDFLSHFYNVFLSSSFSAFDNTMWCVSMYIFSKGFVIKIRRSEDPRFSFFWSISCHLNVERNYTIS